MEQARHLIDVLSEQLYNELELDLYQMADLHSSKEILTHESTIRIPQMANYVNITQLEGSVYWDYTLPVEIEEYMTFTSSERVTLSREKYKIRHEFVAEALSTTGTDKQIGVELEMLGDDDDKLTPDIFHRDENGIIYVLEIGTTRSPHEDVLARTFNEKMFKYEMPIRNRRLNTPVVYCVIIVGVDKVISNYQLPEMLVNELLTRMKIAVALEDSAKGKGFSITSDDLSTQRTRLAEEILMNLNKIGIKDPNEGEHITITKDYVNGLSEEPNEEDAMKSFSASLSKARDLMRAQQETTYEEQILSYTNTLPVNENTRSDLKSCVQVPLIDCDMTEPTTTIPIFIMAPGDKENNLQRLWSFAFLRASKLETFKEEDKEQIGRAHV